MPDLIAQGGRPQHRWRRTLPAGQQLALGRSEGIWQTPWDEQISRVHCHICWESGRLQVQRIPEARNPIFYGGQPVDAVSLAPGEHFVIGQTTFTLSNEQVDLTIDRPRPVTEQTFSPEYLKRLRFRDADQRIDAISQLPQVISTAAGDEEMFVSLVSLLLSGISRATAAAVVVADPYASEADAPRVLHWDRRLVTGESFRPSRKLILQAVESRQSIVHVWNDSTKNNDSNFTASENTDWAYCTPIEGNACRGWALYIAGRFASEPGAPQASDPQDLRDDVKFTEIAASTLGRLRELRSLEREQASLSQFLSPVVLQAIAGQDPEQVLAPREANVAVLFCDLRGFSRESERSADDLMGLLERVSRALGVTTRNILATGGVVGDFHGDATMGFWGWPLAQTDDIHRCCCTALAIRDEFTAASMRDQHPLQGFRIGVGIATGRAVAGKIGTVDQVKVTAFGPVVNTAARLEGMTRILQAPILLDAETADTIRRDVPREIARVRRVAVVRPMGMEAPLEVSELLPPEADLPQLADSHIGAYESALDALLARDWGKAFELLHQVPASDRVKDFLTVFIAQHGRTAPEDWDGVIPLTKK